MKSRLFLLSIMLLSAAAVIAGCTTSETPVDENKHPAFGHWVSDELIDSASLTYIITDDGNFTEIWSYKGTWSDAGITEYGLKSYNVSYENENDYTFYLSSDGSVLFDDDEFVFNRDNSNSTGANTSAEGRWIHEKPEYKSHGIMEFNPDMTLAEIWDYKGYVNVTGFDEDKGYKLHMEFAKDSWNFNATVSSDKTTFTDSNGNLFHKKA